MSQSEVSYPLSSALRWAEKYAERLCPFVERVVTVGSVRRRKSQVHDLEFLVMPLPGTQADLFGAHLSQNRLDEQIYKLAHEWDAVILTNGPQTKKLRLLEGPILEIYVSTQQRWPVEMVIKTGDKEFSHRCVTARREGGYLPSNCLIRDGWQVYRGETRIPLADEGDFLRLLGFPGDLAPELRNGATTFPVFEPRFPANVSVETGAPNE